MTVTRAEFSNGYANMYDELGRKVRSVACHSLIGYGPKGVVVNLGSMIAVVGHDCSRQMMPQFIFNQKQWELHDDYLQVGC